MHACAVTNRTNHITARYVRATRDQYNLSCTAQLCWTRQQQPLLWSLTPRKLRLDSHDFLCARARLVGAQLIHSSKFLGGRQLRHNGLSVYQHHASQCECSSRVLLATPHIVGLIPSASHIVWYVLQSTQHLTKTCGTCHPCAIFPE